MYNRSNKPNEIINVCIYYTISVYSIVIQMFIQFGVSFSVRVISDDIYDIIFMTSFFIPDNAGLRAKT